MENSTIAFESEPKQSEQVRSLPKMGFRVRAATEFCVKLGKSYAETCQMLLCAYGSEHISPPAVQQWYTRFKNGNKMPDDDEESSHRISATEPTRVDSYRRDDLIKVGAHPTMEAELSSPPTSTSIRMEDEQEYGNGTAETNTVLHKTSDINYSAAGCTGAKFNQNPQNPTGEVIMLESDSESSDDREVPSNGNGSSARPQCHICSRFYKSYNILRAHLKIHAETHKCSRCGASFANSYKLKQHEMSHSGLKKFACGICHKDFGYEHNLRRHMWMCHNKPDSTSQSSHSGELFKCTICEYTLRDASELHRHMMGHTKSRPLLHHKCSKCDQTFTRMAHLNRHLRTHLPTKAHQCDFCGESFREAFDLKRHRKQHLETIDASSSESHAVSPPHDSNIVVAMEPQETVYPDVVSFTEDMYRDAEMTASPVDELVEDTGYFQETVPIKMEPDDAANYMQPAAGSRTANKRLKSELQRTKATPAANSIGNSKKAYHRCHVCFNPKPVFGALSAPTNFLFENNRIFATAQLQFH